MIRRRLSYVSMLCVLSVLLLVPSAYAQTKAEKAEQIDELLAQYHAYGLFNGVVLAADDDEIIYEEGFGEADMAWDIPATPETKFLIGSVTKQFTAAVILQLVEDGEIDLHASVRTYLPEYPQPQGDQITVHHLLTHTSGIPNYTGFADFWADMSRDSYAPDSFVTEFSAMELTFEPGTEWAYSNSGYFLLGAIIERVTGRPYEEVLEDQVLEPLDLDDTGYGHYANIIERRARGYVKAPGGYRRAPYFDPSTPYAAGMMFSTVEDLFRWNRLLYTGAPFDEPETRELMFTPYAATPMPGGELGYGYGWFIGKIAVGDDSVSVVEHGGGIPGFITGFRRMPEQRDAIIVLDNTSSSYVGDIVEGITNILYGEPAAAPKQPIADVLRRVITADGIDAALARYRELRDEAPDAYDFSEAQLNQLGYEYLNQGATDTAIAIFRLNVEAFPEAPNTYDSLGEAYMVAGERDKAIANYQKALELNPGSANAKRMLERLGVTVDEADVELPEEVLASYVGKYQIQPGFILAVTREGDRLFTQATGQARVEVFPSARDEFYLKVTDAQLSFTRNDAGEVEGLVLHQGGRDIPAPKIE